MSKISRLHDVSWQLHLSPLMPEKSFNVDCFSGLFVIFPLISQAGRILGKLAFSYG